MLYDDFITNKQGYNNTLIITDSIIKKCDKKIILINDILFKFYTVFDNIEQ